MNYKIYPCKKCKKIELSKKNKSGFCRSCGLLGNKRANGFIHTKEARKKIGLSNIGKNNGMWKGQYVGIKALHLWVKKRIFKPIICGNCNLRKVRDLANKGIYDRDLKNWEWLCRFCHMTKDGRMQNLKQYAKSKKNNY